MHEKKTSGGWVLALAFVVAVALFWMLYRENNGNIAEELPTVPADALDQWTPEDSMANGQPLEEDKSIYKNGVDSSIHDVYITAFPTKDETGKILTLGDFAYHTSRNHKYNPVLRCHIDILDEDEKPDWLLGTSVSPNATIRVRGNSSRGDDFKSYKVKLNEEATPFNGQTVLNLNKHSKDQVKIVTKFCTDLIRDIPNLCSYETNFMRIWLKDASLPEEEQEFEYQGLYTNTEQPNKTYLRARGLPENCSMYKARDFSFMPREELLNVDDPNYDEELFETVLGIRESKDHAKLLDMLDHVNDLTTDFEDVFHTYFNEDNYITWLAFSLLVGSDDILNHNFIIYSPQNSMTWYFIPWDFDSNFYRNKMPESLAGGQKLNMVTLHRRFFRAEGNIQKLNRKMDELMQKYMSREKMQPILESYMPVLDQTMTLMPDVTLTDYAPTELRSRVMSLMDMVEENYYRFKKAFQYPAPMYVSIPEELGDGKVKLSWQPSFSYQNRTITYDLRIATDYNMKNVVFEANGLVNTELTAEMNLPNGIYFLDVHAVDSEGNDQISLEHYEEDLLRFVYRDGLLRFEITQGEDESAEPEETEHVNPTESTAAPSGAEIMESVTPEETSQSPTA